MDLIILKTGRILSLFWGKCNAYLTGPVQPASGYT